ncbi:AI-2E family transporter [Peptoniphilus sp. GNH]|nr:hypothetical protein HMPREF3189_00178 [Clostridiales bacterium KA00134]UHR03141.1 AI-2E family transporter [Peptoniphilus sp. GNH]
MRDGQLIIDTVKTSSFFALATSILFTVLLFLIIYYLINIGNRHIDRDRRIHVDLKLGIKFVVCLVSLYIVVIIFKRFPILGDALWAVVLAAILAYVINPLVNFLEKKGVKRIFGLVIVYVGSIFIISLLAFIVVPKTLEEFSKLFANLPSMVSGWSDKLDSFLNNVRESISKGIGKSAASEYDPVGEVMQSFEQFLIKFSKNIVAYIETLPQKFSSIANGFIKFCLALVLTFYFVLDKDLIVSKMKQVIPPKYRKDASFLGSSINDALMDFVKGRLLMAVFVGVATGIVLLICGVNFAIVIGIITIIADIIPYIGPFIAFVPAILFAAMDSPIKALIVGVFFVLIQWAENNILAAKLIGSSTGLHPIVILLSILIGGGIFGVAGLILSVPAVSVIIILFNFFKKKLEENRNPLN